MRDMIQKMRGWLAREDGTATVEFVTVMPLAVAIFFASTESAIISLRKTFLDRAVEYTVRELRLGLITDPTKEVLKAKICERMTLVDNCAANLTLELNVVVTSGNSITIPSITNICVDRASETEPVVTYTPGAANDLVLVRACLVQDVVFPTSTLQVAVGDPDNNEYQLISTTLFVNEPE